MCCTTWSVQLPVQVTKAWGTLAAQQQWEGLPVYALGMSLLSCCGCGMWGGSFHVTSPVCESCFWCGMLAQHIQGGRSFIGQMSTFSVQGKGFFTVQGSPYQHWHGMNAHTGLNLSSGGCWQGM